jgi:ParB family transcriptional regulator, chromosome partitioning protein
MSSWAVRESNDDEDDAGTGEDVGGAESDEDAVAEPDTGNGEKQVNNTPREPEAPSATQTEQPPWPFSTATMLNSAQADSRTA